MADPRLWMALLALLALSGCAPGGAVRGAQQQIEAGDLAGARRELEHQKVRNPGSVDARVALGEVYYRMARQALDGERDETRYLAFLEKSQAEFVTAVEIEPRDSRPHFYIAVMDTYRGDLWKALRGFNNARKLRPDGIAYTNIAEIYVYLGHLEKARRWNDLGLRKNAYYGAVVFNDMLIAWKEGEMREARVAFDDLLTTHPDMLREINVARLPRPPRSFEEFAGYCCGSPACGPYMQDPCKALALEVQQREISKEAVLQELRIEMETQRRLQRVYEQRKELDLDVDPAPPAN